MLWLSYKVILSLPYPREGRTQYEKAFGVSSGDLFEAIYRWEALSVVNRRNAHFTTFAFHPCLSILSLSVRFFFLFTKTVWNSFEGRYCVRESETEGVWTGSDVRKLGAKRMQPPLSFRTRVFIVSSAHSFNASPICWLAVFRGHMQ